MMNDNVMTNVILKTAVRVIVPTSLVFAFYLYFKGHQTPGGGFVAGLVAGVAIIIHRMACGKTSMYRLLPCPERTLIAIGLTLAVLTGIGALVQGLPFLTSNFGYIELPGSTAENPEYFEWASVMVFDFGVMLVVSGVVVGMISALSEELKI